jgi:hypothetical protein
MSAPTTLPRPTTTAARRGGFAPVLRAEWTKFRTVRGWTIGLAAAAVLGVLFAFLTANGGQVGICGPPPPGQPASEAVCHTGHPFVPTGPGGEPVADTYYFVHQPLTGDGTVTTRVTALSGLTSTHTSNVAGSLAQTRPGLAAWAKAGILLTPTTAQGTAYAAVTTTGGHGDRWQYSYTHDTAGLPGSVSVAAPRWLRLTRASDTLTGYDSTDGTHWNRIGATHLAGLPPTVTVGLFVTSPETFQGSGDGFQTLATATFDHVGITAAGAGSATGSATAPATGTGGATGTGTGTGTPNAWHGESVGAGLGAFYPTLPGAGYHRSGGAFTVSGSGDIAPAVDDGADTPTDILLVGFVAELIAMIVVATMFITTEYRRGLIRTTFAATPDRRRVLAAKAIVIGAVAFVTAAVAAAVALPLGEHLRAANGGYLFPASALTKLRVVTGAAAVAGVTAAAVLAVGTIARKSAGAVTAGIVVFVLPYILGSFISGGAEQWLYRLSPAAGLAALQVLPHPTQVSYPYTVANGYYPLSPCAGLAVLCAYAAIALAVAGRVLRRTDA